MWTTETALTPRPRCPLCGGADRSAANVPPGEAGFYTNAMLAAWDLDPATVLGRLALWQCAACATLWYDPWLHPDLAAGAYGYVAGRHKYGWAALRAWVAGLDRPYVHAHRRLWTLVERLLPGLSRYAEVNCPFAGLLPELLSRRAPDFDRRTALAKISALGGVYASSDFRLDASPAEALRGLAGRLPRGADLGVERLLLVEPSPICWGTSCAFAGANCRAVAQDLLVDRIAGLGDLGTGAPGPDAIGLFHVLDHFPEPLPVLERALAAADLVILEMHAWAWTDAQHPYNIGTGLGDLLAARGHHAVDVSAHATEDGAHGAGHRFLLCSSKLDLGHALGRLGIGV